MLFVCSPLSYRKVCLSSLLGQHPIAQICADCARYLTTNVLQIGLLAVLLRLPQRHFTTPEVAPSADSLLCLTFHCRA